jgi:FixJ family two-component response regulator
MTPESGSGYFIALVDDEPRIHEAVSSMLDASGMLRRRVSFEDPVGFLSWLKETEEVPDLILLDVHFENAGLSGVDILPFIREDHPYLPVILLSGMDTDAMREAQEFPCTYFIPKPVGQEQLTRMISFYLGKSRKSGEYIEQLEEELDEVKEYQSLLEEELDKLSRETAEAKTAEEPAEEKKSKRGKKPFEKIKEILASLLPRSEITPSFVEDLEAIYTSQFNLFKKVIETLVRFDMADESTPGLDIHKHKGTDNVFAVRLSVKVRLYYYKGPKSSRKKLLRLDTTHDTKGMDKWLKSNYPSYAE